MTAPSPIFRRNPTTGRLAERMPAPAGTVDGIPSADDRADPEPYIKAVANALTTAGFPVSDIDLDDRDAEIQLGDTRNEEYLRWDEETGWWIECYSEDGYWGASRLRWGRLGVLPAPEQVATWLRAVRDTPPGYAGRAPHYRDAGDEDGFEDQLRSYWSRDSCGTGVSE